jgi:hypothetical protein
MVLVIQSSRWSPFLYYYININGRETFAEVPCVFFYHCHSVGRGRDLNPRPTSALPTELCRCAPPRYIMCFLCAGRWRKSLCPRWRRLRARWVRTWRTTSPAFRSLQSWVSWGGILNHLSPELGFIIVVFGDRIHDSCRQYKNLQRLNTNRQRDEKKIYLIFFFAENWSVRMFEK